MKYLYSVAIFRLIYRDKKDVLKRFKIHREGESNVNNKPVNDYEFKHLEAARTAYSKSAKDIDISVFVKKLVE